QPVYIFCGKGNNGGDGLAIASELIQHKYKASIFILETEKKGSVDFEANREKLEKETLNVYAISTQDTFPIIPPNTLIIDALFGTGLNKPLQLTAATLVNYLNKSCSAIISIDIPSGLYADKSSKGNTIIAATHTLSFQQYKLAFLMAENESYCGKIHILDINLHKQFVDDEQVNFELIDKATIQSIYTPRKKFTHKGTYGHAALIAGSYGMMGAAILSALGCLRSGAGKLTSFIPACGYTILQTAVPEAMCAINGEDHLLHVDSIEKYDAIGIGPGMGMYPSNLILLENIFSTASKPVVVDADALNLIAQNMELLKKIPPKSILTPHPKEFERLFGKTENDFDKIKLALEKSYEYQVYIVLKGHFTCTTTPEGKGYFNCTGNPGMATAGSGDVLTGIITGLLSQKYTPLQACLLGVYLHGAAGDIAANNFSMEAMIAGDIATSLGAAFATIFL
ncbi:MAG: NAD(P)H-hydrate dehydratase, partial [Ferruginibacter sp.]